MPRDVKNRNRAPAAGGRGREASDEKFFAGIQPAERFSNLPPGTYEGFVKPGSAQIEEKPNKTGKRAVMTLVVTSPQEFENRQQRFVCDLSTDIGKSIFLGELKTMGFGEPVSLREAADILADTDNLAVSFWVSEPKDENPPKVRINDILGTSAKPAEAGRGGRSESKGRKSRSEAPAPEYTKDEIYDMKGKQLDKLAESLNLNPGDFKTDEDLQDACIDELKL